MPQRLGHSCLQDVELTIVVSLAGHDDNGLDDAPVMAVGCDCLDFMVWRRAGNDSGCDATMVMGDNHLDLMVWVFEVVERTCKQEGMQSIRAKYVIEYNRSNDTGRVLSSRMTLARSLFM
jgi:hypothetical protein